MRKLALFACVLLVFFLLGLTITGCDSGSTLQLTPQSAAFIRDTNTTTTTATHRVLHGAARRQARILAAETEINAGKRDIYTISKFDGTGTETKVTTDQGDFHSVYMCSDNKTGVFVAHTGSDPQIYIGTIGRQDAVQLTSDATNKNGAVLSPDCKTIAFTAEDPENGYLHTINLMKADGSGRTALPLTYESQPLQAWSVTFSPDGAMLAFEGWNYNLDPYVDSIFVVKIDGSGLTNIGKAPERAWQEDPNFSKDGKQVYFMQETEIVSEGYSWKDDIYVAASDGSSTAPVQLTTTGNNFDPLVVTDAVLFVSTRDTNAQMYTMNNDGSNQKLLMQKNAYNDFFDEDEWWGEYD